MIYCQLSQTDGHTLKTIYPPHQLRRREYNNIANILFFLYMDVRILAYMYTDITERERVRVMVLNTTFNNISVISLRSVLLVEETGITGENH